MRKKNSVFRSIVDYITDGMAVISGLLISIMALMICVAVVMRYYLHLSVGWSTEIQEYLLYVAVLLAAPWVLKIDKHVNIDVLINSLSPTAQKVVKIFTDAIGVIIGVVLFYYSVLTVYENYLSQVLLIKILPIPKYAPLLFIPIMALFLTFQFMFKVSDSICSLKQEGKEATQGIAEQELSDSGI